MSESEGACCSEVPHLPTQPLKLLHSLSAAMKTLTLSIRQMLYSHGSCSSEADTKQHSALNTEAAEYQQVREMPALRGLSEARSIGALGSEVCCSIPACQTRSIHACMTRSIHACKPASCEGSCASMLLFFVRSRPCAGVEGPIRGREHAHAV